MENEKTGDRRTEKRKTGDWGEEKACELLKRKGYRIAARNFSSRTGEIDIIAVKEECICFVEVKTRKSLEYGLPCQAVDAKKRQRIKKTAEYYLMTHPWTAKYSPRLDIIEILTLPAGNYIRHIENAFS